MKTLTIGQVARRAGVGVETVRFYERQALIAEPPRRPSGYRQYSKEVIARLRFIKRGRELGFSLDEIKELLDLRRDPATTCADIKRRTEAKIQDMNERIRALQEIKKALTKLTAACKGRGPVGECPILEALEHEEPEP